MKKIMFNDGLTQAVLKGWKTMTRRIIKTPRAMEGKDVYGFCVVKYPNDGNAIEVMAVDENGAQINNILPKFSPGEVVAVAQRYSEIMPSLADSFYQPAPGYMKNKAGWDNKMFVRSDIMPHRIRITDVRIERIQDISDEDCLDEGVEYRGDLCGFIHPLDGVTYDTPREAFASLIKKISGKKAWEDNPWVFVYKFELVNRAQSIQPTIP